MTDSDAVKGEPVQGAVASLIPVEWNVPVVFRHRLGDSVGRQRAMDHEGHLLLVLHAPPLTDDAQRDGRLFWRKPDGEWLSTFDPQSDGRTSLRQHLASYAETIETLSEREAAAQTATEYFAVVSELNPLYRSARNQHLAFQQAREAIADARDIINLRDRAYEIERAAELLHSDTRSALEFTIARRAEQQAEASYQMAVSAHRLNVLVAYFFPIATICAVFGTNLQHGLESAYAPWPFLVSILCGLIVGAVLRSSITRPQRDTSHR